MNATMDVDVGASGHLLVGGDAGGEVRLDTLRTRPSCRRFSLASTTTTKVAFTFKFTTTSTDPDQGGL
jgi:hypothetical protein